MREALSNEMVAYVSLRGCEFLDFTDGTVVIGQVVRFYTRVCDLILNYKGEVRRKVEVDEIVMGGVWIRVEILGPRLGVLTLEFQ